MFSEWKKYFVDAAILNKKYTVRSRNLLNISICCLVVSCFFSWAIFFVDVGLYKGVASDIGVRHDGVIAVGKKGFRQMGMCIAEPVSAKILGCVDAFTDVTDSAAGHKGRKATGVAIKYLGLVELFSDGIQLVSFVEKQRQIIRHVVLFLSLIILAAIFAAAAIVRQRKLILEHGGE